MNRTQFRDALVANQEACMNLIDIKNADYAKDSDPFSNFRTAEMMGLSPEDGILLRFLDKVSRLTNVYKNKETAVSDERIEDTILDAMNYLNIFLCYRQNSKSEGTNS